MMNKTALGLSALGLLVFTAPAFAEEKDKPAGTTSESTEAGKKASGYSSEQTPKSGDATKSTTDQEKAKKTTDTGMTTESSSKSKQTEGTGGSGSKTQTTKEKSETDSSGKAKEEKKN